MRWTDEYLEKVASQIRVKRAREPLTEELREHMECQKAAYLAEGMSEAGAERRTVAGMGDALLVGGELDRVHRTRMQWRSVFAALFLLVLGLLFQQLFAAELSGGFLGSKPRMITDCAGAGMILLLVSTDYTSLVKLAYPALAMWVLFLMIRLAEAFSLGSVARTIWRFGFLGASAAERVHQAAYAIVPECACLAGIRVLALLICALRGRGHGGFYTCAALPLLTGALFYLASFTGWTEELCLPLLSYGNVVLLFDAALIGLLLSALRGEAVPEPSTQPRITRSEAASSQSAARA